MRNTGEGDTGAADIEAAGESIFAGIGARWGRSGGEEGRTVGENTGRGDTGIIEKEGGGDSVFWRLVEGVMAFLLKPRRRWMLDLGVWLSSLRDRDAARVPDRSVGDEVEDTL